MDKRDNLWHTYLSAIAELTERGDAREESYYSALEELVAGFAQARGRTVQITVVPKPTEAGNPDFRIWDGSHQVIGYMEAKAPGAKLDQIENTPQLQRYRETFPNLILTDFYEFRLYRDGLLVKTALLARPWIAQTLHLKPPAEQKAALEQLLESFLDYRLPPAMTAEALSRQLARRTRFLRDEVVRPELAQKQKDIYGFYEAFEHYLIAGLSEEQFADLYAQTLVYGLFAARTRAKSTFHRRMAHDLIPSTIGILRDIFQFISLGKPSKQMEVMVDDIAAVLNAAHVQAILEQYYRQGKGDDPILHFYETFLAEYDPETRERRGVYYTPLPVVRYMVRAVHELLQSRFDLADGLADGQVTLLDPAAGTLTFLAEAIRLALQTYTGKYGEGGKARFLRTHILPHFYAFELLMAPYAIGHMKIGFLLESLGVPLENGERFQFYLTNTLEMTDLEQITIPGLRSLSEESHQAARIKKQEPILVILGNPPYSGISANTNPWTESLLKTDQNGLQSYYTVDGQPLGEKNPKWLQDDYVKFLRFAQWKIHRAGRGIVAMITNHSYLDNPTFRGMRQSLLKTFDEIYLLDLHGNSLKREKAPDGGPDENVFDIRQGVAIGIFVKHGKTKRRRVCHADLYGRQEEKYAWLDRRTLKTARYRPIRPQSPFYFFIPQDTKHLQTYLSWPQIAEIFPLHSVGIVTARDRLTIHWTPEEVWRTVLNFSRLKPEIAREVYQLGKDVRDWKVSLAQEDLLREGGPHRDKIVPILYRPFDVRYTYYTGISRGFLCMPRPEVMRHMLAGKNLALITPKQHKSDFGALVTNVIGGHKTVAAFDINYYFPLYLYEGGTERELRPEQKPNLVDWLLPKLRAAYGFRPSPEQVVAYLYAVLYSPTYRKKYAEQLRTDFPRVPWTAEGKLFRQMARLGQRLIGLHLLDSPELDPPAAKYHGRGNDMIHQVRYDETTQRLYINPDNYFEPISPAIWTYQIGGYQVLAKYLKDRKGRRLDDPVLYLRIATAIARTLEVQGQIDALYPEVESNVLSLGNRNNPGHHRPGSHNPHPGPVNPSLFSSSEENLPEEDL